MLKAGDKVPFKDLPCGTAFCTISSYGSPRKDVTYVKIEPIQSNSYSAENGYFNIMYDYDQHLASGTGPTYGHFTYGSQEVVVIDKPHYFPNT